MADAHGALRFRSLLLAWAWGALLVVALPVVAIAAILLVGDASADQSEWDGLGTALGAAGISLAGPVVLVSAVMLAVTRSGRRRHDRRAADVTRLHRAGVLSLVWAAVGLAAVIGRGASSGPVLWLAVLLLGSVLGSASGVVDATRRVVEGSGGRGNAGQ